LVRRDWGGGEIPLATLFGFCFEQMTANKVRGRLEEHQISMSIKK